MFGNQSNQRNDGVNVNTNFKVFFSDASCLSIGAWNTQFSIRITPVKGVDASGYKQYDSTRKVNTAIVPEKAILLKEGIDKIIFPAIRENVKASVSISMGALEKRSILSIVHNVDESGKGYMTLEFSTQVQENNATSSGNVYTYRFNDNSFAEGYDPNTGSITKEVPIFTEFMLFYDILSNYTQLLPFAYHSNRLAMESAAKFKSSRNPDVGNALYEAPVTSTNDDDYGLPFN